jgi:hypothetical protein
MPHPANPFLTQSRARTPCVQKGGEGDRVLFQNGCSSPEQPHAQECRSREPSMLLCDTINSVPWANRPHPLFPPSTGTAADSIQIPAYLKTRRGGALSRSHSTRH